MSTDNPMHGFDLEQEGEGRVAALPQTEVQEHYRNSSCVRIGASQGYYRFILRSPSLGQPGDNADSPTTAYTAGWLLTHTLDRMLASLWSEMNAALSGGTDPYALQVSLGVRSALIHDVVGGFADDTPYWGDLFAENLWVSSAFTAEHHTDNLDDLGVSLFHSLFCAVLTSAFLPTAEQVIPYGANLHLARNACFDADTAVRLNRLYEDWQSAVRHAETERKYFLEISAENSRGGV